MLNRIGNGISFVTGEGISGADPDVPVLTAPANTVAPVASGTGEVDESLSCTTGTWTGNPAPTYGYQWRRDAVDISGATSSTYTLVEADAETNIDCVVTATNSQGSTSADSNDIAIAALAPTSPFVDSVESSAVFHLSASLSGSYSGTGIVLANGVAAPANGDSQSDLDFTLNGPTFNGTADTDGSYFSFDGSDQIDLTAASNPDFFRTLHQDAQEGWLALSIRFANTSTFQRVIQARDNFNGWMLQIGSNQLAFYIEQSNTSVFLPVGSLSAGVDYTIIYSFDNSAGDLRYWINSATKSTASFTPPNKADADAGGIASIGAQPSGLSAVASGTRIYDVCGGNSFIDDTEAAAIKTLLDDLRA